MAGSSMTSGAKLAGYTLGGSAAAVLFAAIFAGVLTLSLLPLYSPNNSDHSYGEIYLIPGLTIKVIFSNLTQNFTAGNVLSLFELSQICTRILQARRIPDFYACLATNFSAYGQTGNLDRYSILQRRAANDVALYEIGYLRIMFLNTCANRRALGRWFTTLSRHQNSSCLARRAQICRSFITTPNTGEYGNQWEPLPLGYTQLLTTNATGSGCAAISIGSMFNIAYYNYAAIYGRYNLTGSYTNAGDCLLESIVPQSYIQNLVNNQTSLNGSVCSSTIG